MSTRLGKHDFKPIKIAYNNNVVVKYMQNIKIDSLSNICNIGVSDLSDTAYTHSHRPKCECIDVHMI